MDLEEIFELGKHLLNELQDRHIFEMNYITYFKYYDRITTNNDTVPRTRFNAMIEDGNILARNVRYVGGDHNWNLSTWPYLQDMERVSFMFTPSNVPAYAPNCERLTTIVNNGASLAGVFPDNFFQNMKNVRVLSLEDSGIKSLPSSLYCLDKSLKLLNLHKCQFVHLPASNLRALGKLEVLDLSETPLKEFLENFFEGMQCLRVLDLSECKNLLSLPPSISCLLNLENFLLLGCYSLNVLPSSVQPLKKLKFLDLSKTKIFEIPELFFLHMIMLKNLNLSFNSYLKSLPMSISNLVSLKKLNLEHCSGLENIIPSLRHLSSSLEELNLSACKSLQDVKHISSSFRDMIPKLRALDLSDTPVRFISLRDLSSLETLVLKSNIDLEVVDLSCTNLQKFLLDGDLKTLKRLDLQGVKHLLKVNWNEINSLPEEVNWDQCGDCNTKHVHIPLAEWRRDGNGRGTFISVENANIFKTLPESHSWIKGRFLVYVCPCTEEAAKRKAVPSQWPRYRYKDIHPFIRPSIPSYERWLGIERVERFPKGISVVLSHAQFFSLHDEDIILRLSDLGIGSMAELKECWIERCQAMKVVFDIGAHDLSNCQPVLRQLEKLRISNLSKLTNMCTSTGILKDGSFGNLKHLLLEYCPQVVTVFSSGVCLESLEVLEIKFCARLEEIFSAKVNADGSLRRLHTLCLLELPSLKSIVHNVQLASLNKVSVKGCPMLRKFPLQRNTSLNCNTLASSLVVTGEPKWWEQLEWDDDENVKQHISFNSWKPFRFPKQP